MTFPDSSVAVDAATASQDSNSVAHEQGQGPQTPQDQAQAVYELEKLGKFKFDGQDWTPEDLKKAVLRMKDYTTKTQALSEEKKSYSKQFEQKEHFYKNLPWDLDRVKKDPNLIPEFIKVYPAEFHQILKDHLNDVQPSQSQSKQTSQPLVDVELLSRVNSLEQTFQQQEIAKNEALITQTMSKMASKYPDAIPDLVLARAYEVHDAGTKLTDQVWEQIYKQVDAQGKQFVKARYGDLVKQQKSANEKARGVESGGGIPGQAPKKLSFREATEAAVRDLSGKR